MKVVYQSTIIAQIIAAKHKALLAERTIEKIILSFEEVEQLKRETDNYTFLGVTRSPLPWLMPGKLPAGMKIIGIPVEAE